MKTTYKIWCEGEGFYGWIYAWPVGAIVQPEGVLNDEEDEFECEHYNIAKQYANQMSEMNPHGIYSVEETEE